MTINYAGRPPARIALLHHTGGGNLGDDAIVESIISNIKRRWPEAAITVISMNPQDTESRHGVASYPMRRHVWPRGYKPNSSLANDGGGLLEQIRTSKNPLIRLPRAIFGEVGFLTAAREKLQSFDLMILCGGGQLTDRSGPWGFPYAIFSWFLLAKSVQLKCVILNTGAGPLFRPLSKFFVTHALHEADYVSFRDEESQALVQKIGFTGPSHVFPDNVYGLDMSTLCPGGPKKHDQRLVGIAPMPYPADPPFDAKKDKLIYEELIAKLAAFASELSHNSRRLTVFGTDIGADPAAVHDLRSKLAADYNLSTPPYEPVESLEALLLKMSELDYVVTCRYHGVVFAHLLNKPVLAIAHHPKVTHLMNTLGLSRYCVDIRTFDPHALAQTFECLVSNEEEVKKQMAASLKGFQSRLKLQFDELWPSAKEESVLAVR